jgi:hypothetical protein
VSANVFLMISIITQLTASLSKASQLYTVTTTNMSEPPAKAAATSSTEQRSLENEAILRQVLMLLIGQGVFVRTVAKDWLKTYETVLGDATAAPGRLRMKADSTLYEAAFSSVSCMELAHEWGLKLDSYKMPHRAGKYADIATLQRAGELGMRLQDVVEGAAESGRLDKLIWLHIDQKHPLPYRADEAAARSGHAREMLGWLKETAGVALTEGATYYAAKTGDIDALDYLHVEQGIALSSSCYTTEDLPTLKWLHAHDGLPVARLSIVTHTAAGSNKLSTLQWATSVGAAFTADTILAAVQHGHIEMVQYLIADGCAFNRAESYKHAISRGQLDVLKWLDEHHGKTKATADDMCTAATFGHLAVCQYLREQGYKWSKESKEAVTAAAHSEHHDVVKWLITECCPIKAAELGVAVVSNYDSTDNSVNMLKWLSEHGVVWKKKALTEMLHTCGTHAQLEAAKYVKQLGAAWPKEFVIDSSEHGDEEERQTWHQEVRDWAVSAGCRAPIIDYGSEDDYCKQSEVHY